MSAVIAPAPRRPRLLMKQPLLLATRQLLHLIRRKTTTNRFIDLTPTILHKPSLLLSRAPKVKESTRKYLQRLSAFRLYKISKPSVPLTLRSRVPRGLWIKDFLQEFHRHHKSPTHSNRGTLVILIGTGTDLFNIELHHYLLFYGRFIQDLRDGTTLPKYLGPRVLVPAIIGIGLGGKIYSDWHDILKIYGSYSLAYLINKAIKVKVRAKKLEYAISLINTWNQVSLLPSSD